MGGDSILPTLAPTANYLFGCIPMNRSIQKVMAVNRSLNRLPVIRPYRAVDSRLSTGGILRKWARDPGPNLRESEEEEAEGGPMNSPLAAACGKTGNRYLHTGTPPLRTPDPNYR